MKKYKLGFSFAEIMISLVVVGVISMLVIPNLLDNSTNRTNVAAAAKARYDVGQASLRLQAECPRFRCDDASASMRDLIRNSGAIRFSVSDVYNDGTDDIIEVLIDVDEDDATDLSVAATQAGGIKDIPNCSYETYENGAGCTDEAISSMVTGNDAVAKTRSGNQVNFRKID